MSFPAPSTPQVIHIFVDDFNININSAPALPLIDQGTTGWNNFYTQLCQPNCVNTLSIYDTRGVLPGKSNLVGNFIELGKTTYGICEVAGSVNPYDTPDGSDYIDRIITHNSAQSSNQNRKYDYITLENEYWNFNPGSSRNPLVSGLSSYSATTNATNTTVNITPSGINGTSIQTGYMIEVNGEYRQIISIGTSTITVDRPFSVASGPTSFTVVNNQTYYDLDFDTFLYRVKNVIRPLALANNLKIEAYIGRNSEAYWTNAFRRIIPHLDRLLIEVEQNVSGFRYNEASNSARNAILKCSATRTGTITINGNTIFGTGTDFANDLGIKTRIYCNGQIFTILSINTATQQATTLETASPNITTQSTYTTYFDYAPIIYSNMTSVATWLSSTPKLSYLDAYKFFSQSGYSVGAKIQGGTAPLSVNAETVANVQNSANLVGISLYARVLNMDDVQPNIVATNSQIPCPTCGVTPPSASSFTIQTSSTNPTCNNAVNGSITTNFNTAGLTSPYIYTYVNGSTTYQVTTNTVPYTFSGLGTGTWTVTVSDSAGTPNVSNTSSVSLTNTFNPTWTTGVFNITFNLSGGYNNYYIAETDSTFATYLSGGFFISNLTSGSYTYLFNAGTHYFVIGDTDGCVTTGITITVTNNGAPGLTLGSVQQPTCATSANGSITVNATGTGPFTYTFSATTGGGGSFTSPPTNATTYTYSNAIAGTWSVTVTTAAGTSLPVTTTLSYNFSSSITSTIGNNVCFSIVGGNIPYTITSSSVTPAINNNTNANTYCLTNLLPGSYVFYVNDVSGCTVGPLTTTIAGQTLGLNLLSKVNPNCTSISNGQINVAATGGFSPFTYSAYNTTTSVYAPSNSNGQFTNLSSGVWLITVRDNVNNITTLSVTLSNLFYANITTVGNSICVVASGGTLGSYYVNVNGTSFPYTANTLTCYSANCGTNTVSVFDTDNVITACSITQNVNVICPLGYTYSATPISCSGQFNGSIQAIATGGTPPYQYSISNPIYPPTINNFTGIFNNLGTGNWTLTIDDSLGNSASTIINLTQNFYVQKTPTITGYCLTISGGAEPYVIEIRDTNSLVGNFYTANTAGTYCYQLPCNEYYYIKVTDETGCFSNPKTAKLPCPTPVNVIVLYANDPSCYNINDGVISVSASGGSSTYSYSAFSLNNLYSYNNTGLFTGLSGGTWTIFVQDTFGATASTNVTLSGLFQPEVIINSSGNTLVNVCVTIPPGSNDFPYFVDINNQSFYIVNNNLTCFTVTGFTGCTKVINYSICNNLLNCCFVSGTTLIEEFSASTTFYYYGGDTIDSVCVDITTVSGVTNSIYGLSILGQTFIIEETPYCTTPISGITGCSQEIEYTICAFDNPLFPLFSFNFFEGATPYGNLILGSDNLLYGLAYEGDINGVLFSFDTTINNYTEVYAFSSETKPIGPLVEAEFGTLYGTTQGGGANGYGSLFKYVISSNTYSVLYDFQSIDGQPQALIQTNDGLLYGLTATGGTGNGTIFSFDITANTYSLRYSGFGATFLDGTSPNGLLFEASDGYLYGRTKYNSPNGLGTIFKFNPNTNSVTHVYPFTFSDGFAQDQIYGGFIEINKNLYGLNPNGGAISRGTLIKFNITANTFTRLFYFSPTYGSEPVGSLLLSSDGLLYGLTTNEGLYGFGTLFSYDISNGLPPIVRKNFNDKDGSYPHSSLIEVNNVLYSFTKQGGNYDFGTIFKYLNQYLQTCCFTDSINLGESLNFSVSGTWLTGTTVCVSIDNYTLPPPFYVLINDELYTYNLALTPNCFPITGCGETLVEVSSGIPKNYFRKIVYYNPPTISDNAAPTEKMFKLGTNILIISNSFVNVNTFTIYDFDLNTEQILPKYPSITGNFIYPGFSNLGTIGYYVLPTQGTYGAGQIWVIYGILVGPVLVYEFNNGIDGAYPYYPPLYVPPYLYGSTSSGGVNGYGTIYRLDISTLQMDTLYDISPVYPEIYNLKNFVKVGNKIYAFGEGGIFAYQGLMEFDLSLSAQTIPPPHSFTNYDDPKGLLLGSDGNLYGVATYGGIGFGGYIFSYNITTSTFTVLKEFYQIYDPANPYSLIQASNGKLYGTSSAGGQYNGGTVFEFDISLSSLTVIKSFTIPNSPTCELIEVGQKLYGITYPSYPLNWGGYVFSIDINDNCSFSALTNVPCIQPLTITTLSAITTCNNTGLITINITGGTPNYLVEYTNGIFSNNFISNGGNEILNNLTASTWTVTVTDGNGTGTSVVNTYNLNQTYAVTSISSTGICVTYSGFNNPYQFFIDGVLKQTINNTGGTVCFSASCGVNHVLRIFDAKLCNFYESFVVPCEPVELGITFYPRSACLDGQGFIGLSASGGSPTYHYTLVDLTSLITYTANSNSNTSISIPPPTLGHTYYAYVVDSFGNSADTTTFDFIYTTYGNISFAGGYVYATYSANTLYSLISGYNVKLYVNNVLVSQQNPAPFSGGTIQYPIPCGINVNIRLTETYSIQDVVGTTTCTYTASTFYPCDLGCKPLTVERPCCDQATNGSIGVGVTGGTAPFTYILTGPTGTFSATTTQSNTAFLECINPVVMGMCGFYIDAIISAGTYTVTVIDDNGDTCSQTTNVIPYLNATFTANTNEICVYIDDGPCTLGPYSISVDGVIVYDYVNKTNLSIPSNTVVCFTATCGTHNIQILAPFSPNGAYIIDPCQLNYTVTVPCLTLTCGYIYTNPSCDQLTNGSIRILVTGGTGLYNYTLSSDTGTVLVWPSVGTYSISPYTFYGLYADTWHISVVDQNGNQCLNDITLDGTFDVIVPLTSSTYNTFCFEIFGGIPPYEILIDNIITLTGITSAGTYCVSASCGYHTWEVRESSEPTSNCVCASGTYTQLPSLGIETLDLFWQSCNGSVIGVSFDYLPTPTIITRTLLPSLFGCIIPPITAITSTNITTSINYDDFICVNGNCVEKCTFTGTTYIPCATDLILTLISFMDPGCEGSPGEIIVSATSGTPPYTYTATNGTDIFVNNTGIFTNLNSGTWYLSVSDINFIDNIPPITLTNTFYANVQANSNSLCVTITGGTDPYTVIIDSTTYSYNTSISPNCYSISGCGTSTITIIDSGSGS